MGLEIESSQEGGWLSEGETDIALLWKAQFLFDITIKNLLNHASFKINRDCTSSSAMLDCDALTERSQRN